MINPGLSKCHLDLSRATALLVNQKSLPGSSLDEFKKTPAPLWLSCLLSPFQGSAFSFNSFSREHLWLVSPDSEYCCVADCLQRNWALKGLTRKQPGIFEIFWSHWAAKKKKKKLAEISQEEVNCIALGFFWDLQKFLRFLALYALPKNFLSLLIRKKKRHLCASLLCHPHIANSSRLGLFTHQGQDTYLLLSSFLASCP